MQFFIVEVWKSSKRTFVLFSSIIVLTFYCTVVQFEITPFFLWAHYSERQSPQDSYERIYIKVNGKVLDLPSVSRPTREMMQIPTEEFCKLEAFNYDNITAQMIRRKWKGLFSDEFVEGFIDKVTSTPADGKRFLPWLAKYVERIYDIKVKSIEVGTVDLFPLGRKKAKNKWKVSKQNFKPVASIEL